jgi:hypothetical protein
VLRPGSAGPLDRCQRRGLPRGRGRRCRARVARIQHDKRVDQPASGRCGRARRRHRSGVPRAGVGSLAMADPGHPDARPAAPVGDRHMTPSPRSRMASVGRSSSDPDRAVPGDRAARSHEALDVVVRRQPHDLPPGSGGLRVRQAGVGRVLPLDADHCSVPASRIPDLPGVDVVGDRARGNRRGPARARHSRHRTAHQASRTRHRARRGTT